MKQMSSLEGFLDVPDLLDRVEHDEDLLVELFVLFQEEAPGSLAALRRGLDGSDMAAIETAAHRLKGMLANLSAKDATLLAAGIESAARAGDTGRIQDDMKAFDPQLTGISGALASFLMGEKS